MLDKIVNILINPKTLARLTVVWLVVTVFLSAFSSSSINKYITNAQAYEKLKDIKLVDSESSKISTVNQEPNNNNNNNLLEEKIKTNSPNNNGEVEFEAILSILGHKLKNTDNTSLNDAKLQKPTRIVIKSKNIDLKVHNPSTTDIKILDELLLKGAVRYPTSGYLGEKDKAIVIFGHTSYIPGFFGMYRAFNGVDKLKEGEEVILYSHNKKYVYRVNNKEKVSADSDINLSTNNNKLILITCDGFGSTSIRYKVEADLVMVEDLE